MLTGEILFAFSETSCDLYSALALDESNQQKSTA